jgi:7,8-dihydropterin-6-yl-methyl-4-(beta-D-ribofuranosyl)aminobenzene 5'-phosphate synthase
VKPLFIPLLVLLSATAASSQPTTPASDVTITILADEITVASDLKADLGFACLVESNGRSILFDTGSDGPILLANADSLRKDLSSISAVVISHPHTDHTGGLSYLLTSRVSGIPVYVGQRYFRAFAGLITSWKSRPVAVMDTVQILPGIYSSGELPGSTYEQVLVIDTEKGLVLIAGCAHPGIARIVAHVKDRFRKEVYLVLGGLHLLDEQENTIQETVRQLKTLRVRKCAPTHCTGGTALAIFRQGYGVDLIPAGVGSVIRP